jgi:hypothetical protein
VGKLFEDENPKIRFLVNGRDIDFLKGPGTGLKEGDLVVLIPPVSVEGKKTEHRSLLLYNLRTEAALSVTQKSS